MIIRIKDDIPQGMIKHIQGRDVPADVKVVRLTCECGWEDKTFALGSLPFAVDHFVEKHGGNGTLEKDNWYRRVVYGKLENAQHEKTVDL